MLTVEQVIRMIDQRVRQLEELAYKPDQLALAIKLQGSVEACIEIAQTPNTWNIRIDRAMKMVTDKPPSLQPMQASVSMDQMAVLASQIAPIDLVHEQK